MFVTERTIVRRFTFNDIDFVVELNSNEDVWRFIRPIKNKEESEEALKQWITAYEEHPKQGRWMIELKETNAPVGLACILPLQDTNETQVGYALMPQYWGKGLASEVTEGLLQLAKGSSLETIVAVVEHGNDASVKVLLKNGFRPDGTHMAEKELLLFRQDLISAR